MNVLNQSLRVSCGEKKKKIQKALIQRFKLIQIEQKSRTDQLNQLTENKTNLPTDDIQKSNTDLTEIDPNSLVFFYFHKGITES